MQKFMEWPSGCPEFWDQTGNVPIPKILMLILGVGFGPLKFQNRPNGVADMRMIKVRSFKVRGSGPEYSLI